MTEQRPTSPRWPRFKRHAPQALRYWLARGRVHGLRGRFRRWLYEYELWVDIGEPRIEDAQEPLFPLPDMDYELREGGST